MADFETTAELSIELPTAEVRGVREELEDALGDIGIGMDAGASDSPTATDGGLSPQRERRIMRQSFTLEQQRTDDIETIRELAEDGELGGGGGGGGGGLLPSGGGALAGATGGATAGLASGLLDKLTDLGGGALSGLLTNPFTGVVAAGAGAGLGLREIFEASSFDESELETDPGEYNEELSAQISEQISGIDPIDVAEAVRTEGVVLENADDVDSEVAALIAEQTPLFSASEVEQQLAQAGLLPDAPFAEVIAEAAANDREQQEDATEQDEQQQTDTQQDQPAQATEPARGEDGQITRAEAARRLGATNEEVQQITGLRPAQATEPARGEDGQITRAEAARRLGATNEEAQEITQEQNVTLDLDQSIELDGVTDRELSRRLEKAKQEVLREVRSELPRRTGTP